MSKRRETRKESKSCDNCGNCLYICEGDYVCMAGADCMAGEEPVIIKEEHIPNENFYYCGGELWEKELVTCQY